MIELETKLYVFPLFCIGKSVIVVAFMSLFTGNPVFRIYMYVNHIDSSQPLHPRCMCIAFSYSPPV